MAVAVRVLRSRGVMEVLILTRERPGKTWTLFMVFPLTLIAPQNNLVTLPGCKLTTWFLPTNSAIALFPRR